MDRRLASKIIVIMMAAVIGAKAYQKVRALWPPPAISTVDQAPEGVATIDHQVLDDLLKAHVDKGRIDYAGLKRKEQRLKAYLDALAALKVEDHSRDQLLAMYINAYNAATLKLILEYYPGLKSIKEIPSSRRWKDARWQVAGQTLSLDALEHEVLRAKFTEPRIHFAIVCASVGCPDLRPEAYTGDRIEQQLQDQARQFHARPRNFRWDEPSRTLYLSAIYEWFSDDFEQPGGSVIAYATRFADAPTAEAITRQADNVKIKYLDYDWSLNGQ